MEHWLARANGVVATNPVVATNRLRIGYESAANPVAATGGIRCIGERGGGLGGEAGQGEGEESWPAAKAEGGSGNGDDQGAGRRMKMRACCSS